MNEPAFGQLLYRSRALRPLARHELRQLLDQARERNARESLTGLLVHDGGQFWQWLEGPAAALARVWSSIARDPRHHRVERLQTPWRATRLFPDWRMQLAEAGTVVADDGWTVEEDTMVQLRQGGALVASAVEGMALAAAMPEPATLARLLARGSEADVDAACERLHRVRPSLAALWSHLVRPVSRALGEAWMTDALASTDLVIAHGQLLRLMRFAEPGAAVPVTAPLQGRALVAPLPGERDFAGASFAGMALQAQGWQVICPFPEDRAALETELASGGFELLHLSLSDVFGHHHRLADLAATIRAARRASANPRLQVLVSGRAFSEQPGLSTLVGADGDGLYQGSTDADLAAIMSWAQVRPHSAAAMVAQATLNDVVLHLQRKRFGIPEERTSAAHPQRDAC
jgi:hypothetical protein